MGIMMRLCSLTWLGVGVGPGLGLGVGVGARIRVVGLVVLADHDLEASGRRADLEQGEWVGTWVSR